MSDRELKPQIPGEPQAEGEPHDAAPKAKGKRAAQHDAASVTASTEDRADIARAAGQPYLTDDGWVCPAPAAKPKG